MSLPQLRNTRGEVQKQEEKKKPGQPVHSATAGDRIKPDGLLGPGVRHRVIVTRFSGLIMIQHTLLHMSRVRRCVQIEKLGR